MDGTQLPKDWLDQIDPTTGTHMYVNKLTNQHIQIKPPNESLPDGWTHVYYEQYNKFAYMEIATKKVVASINEITGYAQPPGNQSQQVQPPREQSPLPHPPQQTTQVQHPQQPQQQPLTSQNDLPKGWIEKEQNGEHLYVNEATGQQTQIKPPNETLPDGWFHYYVEQYQRYGYVNPSTKETLWKITDIPGYVPPQHPLKSDLPKGWTEREQNGEHMYYNEVTDQCVKVKPPNEVLPDGWTHYYVEQYKRYGYVNPSTKVTAWKITDIPDYAQPSEVQQSQQSQPPREPSPKQPQEQQQPQQQQPQQDGLPKGWTEKEQNGEHMYYNEVTQQCVNVKPPSEVLPDGWTHYYVEQYQRFGYFNPSKNMNVWNITDIPGYVPPNQQQQQQQQSFQQQQQQNNQNVKSGNNTSDPDKSDHSQKNILQPSQQQQQQLQPLQPQQDSLPKGWIEKEQNGEHIYGNEVTGQVIKVKPPNEVLPDGWTHYYVEQYQRFGYFNPSKNMNVWNITDIPGYVPN